jgi:hypothetical protein
MYAQGVHASLQGATASLRQRAANYAAPSGGVQQSGSGNGASDSYNETTMNSALTGQNLTPPSGNGSSASSWATKKFMQ